MSAFEAADLALGRIAELSRITHDFYYAQNIAKEYLRDYQDALAAGRLTESEGDKK